MFLISKIFFNCDKNILLAYQNPIQKKKSYQNIDV